MQLPSIMQETKRVEWFAPKLQYLSSSQPLLVYGDHSSECDPMPLQKKVLHCLKLHPTLFPTAQKTLV